VFRGLGEEEEEEEGEEEDKGEREKATDRYSDT